MMCKMKIVVALAVLFACHSATASATNSPVTLSGISHESQYLYPLIVGPVDPSLSTVIFQGSALHGSIVMNIKTPNTTCVPCPEGCIPRQGAPPSNQSCGLDTIDATFHMTASLGSVELQSMVNNPGPYNQGTARNVTITGEWVHGPQTDHVLFFLNYFLEADHDGAAPGTALSNVQVRSVYTFEIEKVHGRGQQWRIASAKVGMIANAWVNLFPVPYQIVATHDDFNTNGPNGESVSAAVRARTPFPGMFLFPAPYTSLNAYLNTTAPVGPYYVYGTLKNLVFSKGVVTGTTSLQTGYTVTSTGAPAGVNLVDAPFDGIYSVSRVNAREITIHSGMVVGPKGKYKMDEFKFTLNI